MCSVEAMCYLSFTGAYLRHIYPFLAILIFSGISGNFLCANFRLFLSTLPIVLELQLDLLRLCAAPSPISFQLGNYTQ
jgi:hypothetical protein